MRLTFMEEYIMTDYREELAAAIAEKYLELDALSKESGAYGWTGRATARTDSTIC